jgi:hypothetical protein
MTITIDEAKNILKENMDELVKNPLVTVDEILVKANDIAIKSLEAWEKVREIFKAKSTSEDWEYIHDLQIWEDALEIIDKHLSEVSE